MMRVIFQFIQVVALSIFMVTPASAAKRVALIIGNSDYLHAPSLKNPKNDVADMSDAFQKLGFQTITGIDLQKAGMDKIIHDFAGALKGADVGLFYFAGHALQVSGTNYLVPTDAVLKDENSLDFEMIPLALIQRVMERNTKTNIIFLDACRDNPLARNLARALGTRSTAVGTGLAQVEAGIGTLVSYATQPGNVALDGVGRNSPYTGALKKHINTVGDDLTSILINVRIDVMAETKNRQVPWDQSALTARLYLTDPQGAQVQPRRNQPRGTIEIATVGPMSGSYAIFGEQMMRGAREAVDDLNKAGGLLGAQVKLTVEDDMCDPRAAVAVANKLIGKKISFVAGHFCSGSSIPAAQIYAENGVIQISPASTNPRLTDERAGPSIFRVSGRDDQQGEVAGKFLALAHGDRRVAIVHDKSAYGKGLADQTKTYMNQAGLTEALFIDIVSGENDYANLVRRLKADRIDVVFFGGYHTEAGLIARQMREGGMTARLIAGDALVTQEYWTIAGDAGEGTLMTFSPDPRNLLSAKSVVERFRAKKIEPDGYVLYAYAAVQTWAQAVEAAGDIEIGGVINKLNTNAFRTVIGDISFDQKGDRSLAAFKFYRWSKGSFKQID